jgi:hypothetical protein
VCGGNGVDVSGKITWEGGLERVADDDVEADEDAAVECSTTESTRCRRVRFSGGRDNDGDSVHPSTSISLIMSKIAQKVNVNARLYIMVGSLFGQVLFFVLVVVVVVDVVVWSVHDQSR